MKLEFEDVLKRKNEGIFVKLGKKGTGMSDTCAVIVEELLKIRKKPPSDR